MSVTQLTVVRHGESRWNLEGRQQGLLDSALTNTGLAQARAVPQRLARERIETAIWDVLLRQPTLSLRSAGKRLPWIRA
jgi:probable phosphoglycerate mutase